jgi:hypothetical protein
MPGPSYAQFANTVVSQGFDFTFAPGVTPSVCYIRTVPHVPDLPFDGHLTLRTDDDTELFFPNCKLESPRLEAGQGGQFWTLPILDRRWKWQFAHITGSFNILKPDGTYLRETDPQALAAILLSAMGESNFDVSRLPNDTRPECRWEDTVRADIELEKLCEDSGCIVVLNHLTDHVEIWPVGDGDALPAGPQPGSSYAPVKPSTPFRIRVEAGNTLFQDTFECEPVGLDVDDTWKHIEDLSYKPATGWNRTFPFSGFTKEQIPGTYTLHGRTLQTVDLANANVFRCWRFKGLLKGGWVPHHLQVFTQVRPQSIRDFQLFDELADEELSGLDGGLRRLPAVAYVRAWSKNHSIPSQPVRYNGSFSLIDSSRGIIQFDEPQFRLSFIPIPLPPFQGLVNGILPATVWFETSFHCGQDGVMYRLAYQPVEPLPAAVVTPTRIINRPEILFRSIQRYATNGTAIEHEDNFGEAQQRNAFWYDAAVSQYDLQQGGTVQYARLMPILLDGLTQQITWSASNTTAATTTVSQAQRHNRYVPGLEQQRDQLYITRLQATVEGAIKKIKGTTLPAQWTGVVV